jgi:hypothetical protein
MKLLGCEESSLVLNAMEESEPGLNGEKPIVGFKWVSGFGEQQRVGHQEFHVSGVLGLPG